MSVVGDEHFTEVMASWSGTAAATQLLHFLAGRKRWDDVHNFVIEAEWKGEPDFPPGTVGQPANWPRTVDWV